MTPPDGRPLYPIESVDRALTLLVTLQEADSLSVAEASRRLGVSRSTAYRLLSLLEHREFVRHDELTKTFILGAAPLRVGLAAVHRSDVRAAARPHLERVAGLVDETTHLVVLQGAHAFFLDCVQSTKMIRAAPRVGTSIPAHCSAGGKVLLAHLPPSRVDEILEADLARLTPASKSSAAAVRRELATVRRQGWAMNDGESEIGLRAVAVLVPRAEEHGETDAAITVSGPAQRLDDTRVHEIAELLTRQVLGLDNPAGAL